MLIDQDTPTKAYSTVKGEDTFRNFLTDLGRYPLLEPDQELILSRQIQKMQNLLVEKEENPDREFTKEEERLIKAGKKAKDKFINCNLRMVVNIAKKYLSKVEHLDINDLVMEGIIGLIRAVELFDPSRGYKFSTYAYWWIRQSIGRALTTKERMIRLPVNVEEGLTRTRRINTKLTQKLGRTPTSEEIAQAMKTDAESIDFLYNSSQKCKSLDIVLTDDNGMTLSDIVFDDQVDCLEDCFEFIDKETIVRSVQLLLEQLEEDEQTVMIHKWGLNGNKPIPLHEIARLMGIGREQVRKIAKSAETQVQYIILAENVGILDIIRDSPIRNRSHDEVVPLHLFTPIFNIA
jgi:RNA polymerase primary sigma factor